MLLVEDRSVEVEWEVVDSEVGWEAGLVGIVIVMGVVGGVIGGVEGSRSAYALEWWFCVVLRGCGMWCGRGERVSSSLYM